MFRLLMFGFLLTQTACLRNAAIVDPNIDISIAGAQSYKYDLTKQTYTVFRIFKADTIIHFELSVKEREQIIQQYYDLELNDIKGTHSIEDDCMIMPKLYTTLQVKSQHGLQEIMIDEECSDFKPGVTGEGKRIQVFLKFVKKIINSKPAISSAPQSDILYL
jgi:hypothetical protein